jgi:clan AA aspartic protease
MMLGHVRQRFPRITLRLQGQDQPIDVEFVVDTGFEGDLTVPPNLIARLDAPLVSFESVRMADDSERRVASHEVTVTWDNELRIVELLALDGRPLLGTILLDGYLLSAEMTEGGEVRVDLL